MQFSIRIYIINILYNMRSIFIYIFCRQKNILAKKSIENRHPDRLSWVERVIFFYLKIRTYPVLLGIPVYKYVICMLSDLNSTIPIIFALSQRTIYTIYNCLSWSTSKNWRLLEMCVRYTDSITSLWWLLGGGPFVLTRDVSVNLCKLVQIRMHSLAYRWMPSTGDSISWRVLWWSVG